MSDSTDNTNDLDSYGVWVKRPPQDSSDEADTLPDFSDFDIPEETSSQDGIDIPEVADTPDLSQFESESSLSEEDVSDISFEDSSEDGELSLDDFMDGDFSDSNSGAAAMSESAGSSDSDEISLDDFFDDDSFGSGSTEKEDDVPNDEAIDMDISFNDNEDEIPTEDIKDDEELGLDDIDNNSNSTEALDDMFTTEKPEQVSDNSEEVSLDDFSSSEDVDLSDFGIDSEAEETPVTSNVSESARNTVVDYDLAISDDDSVSEVPMINEVHSSSNQEKPAENTNGTVVDNSLLEKIVSDLASLKSEISTLKTNFEELKSREQITPQPVEKEEPTPEEPQSTFFEDNGDDDTIALDNDELNNIVNTVDITEEEVSISEESIEDTIADEILPDETIPEETEIQEEVISEEETFDAIETTEDDIIEEVPAQEEVISEDTEEKIDDNFTTDTPFGDIEDSEVEIPSESEETESESGLSMDFENESLEEPSFEEETEEEIPEEISIPKVDDIATKEENNDEIFIESNSTDFMDSVSTTETNETSEEVLALDESTESEELEEIADDLVQDEAEAEAEEVATEEEVAEVQEDNPFIEDLLSEDPSVKEGLSDENVSYLTEESSEADNTVEESFEMAEPEVIDEPIEEEEMETSVEEPIMETEEVMEEETDEEEDDDGDLPAGIKNDVKSVLLCMDQLLESLPEDKIMEFAKSEQFATYKKLFKDLGLSQ